MDAEGRITYVGLSPARKSSSPIKKLICTLVCEVILKSSTWEEAETGVCDVFEVIPHTFVSKRVKVCEVKV